MSDALLEYLVANSELAQSLEQPVTLEELLAHQSDQAQCVRLLATLPQLKTDPLKLSNCVLDSTVPYDSLVGLSNEELLQLAELCDYLMLSSETCKKLNEVIENGINIEKYDSDINKNKMGYWALMGDLRGLQWAYKQGYPCVSELNEDNTCICAAWNGHLECLMWLHEQGCPWDKNTCSYAAYNGHLDCLRYAHDPPTGDGCPWDAKVCEYAAQNGHLDCLQYAHTEGCPWDKNTCENAAYYGHLDCLRYAHTEGCPWDAWICIYAKHKGHLDCMDYVHEQKGCPCVYDHFIIWPIPT